MVGAERTIALLPNIIRNVHYHTTFVKVFSIINRSLLQAIAVTPARATTTVSTGSLFAPPFGPSQIPTACHVSIIAFNSHRKTTRQRQKKVRRDAGSTTIALQMMIPVCPSPQTDQDILCVCRVCGNSGLGAAGEGGGVRRRFARKKNNHGSTLNPGTHRERYALS